jgi:hypothetical protein
MSYHYPSMPDEEKTDPRESSSPPSAQAEPPKIYLPACGALCDIFWWARRTPDRPK